MRRQNRSVKRLKKDGRQGLMVGRLNHANWIVVKGSLMVDVSRKGIQIAGF